MTEREQDIVRKLQKALDLAGNTHTVADVVERIRQGKAQAWEHGGSLAVTELLQGPQRTVANYWLYAGRLDDWPALTGRIEQWARAEGATRVVAGGRRGWQPFVAPYGYRPTGVSYAKDIGA